MRLIFSILLFLLVSEGLPQKRKIITPNVHPGLRFTENKGQWTDKINYMVRMSNGNIYLEKNKLTYFLFDYEKFKTFHTGGIGRYGNSEIKAHAYEVEFVYCQKNITTLSKDRLPYYENYFIGNDSKSWKSEVLNFKRVVYPNIYPEIDFEFLTNDRQLKYNFYVKPGADYHTIQLKYNGVNNLKVSDGNLIIETSIGKVVEEKPIALQSINGQTVEIPCKYKLVDNVVSFEVIGSYNKNFPLIIDPTLVFAAQSGSTADNFGMTATYDAQGNLYTGGTIFNLGYPTTIGAYSTIFNGPNGGTDVVITKYNSVGNAQLYSTYLGGNGSEVVSSLIVSANNELLLYGSTGSSNFPIPISGAYDNSFNGGNLLSFTFNGTTFNNGTDIYVSKFNTAGTTLLASTYVGGSDNDGVNHVNVLSNYNALFTTACPNLQIGNFNLTEYKPDSLQYNYGDQFRGEIQLDKFGNVYIASSTRSPNFPTVNAFDNTLGGKQDAVVFKLNSSLTNLMWSNYLGGSGNDAGYSLIVTDSLHTYVTGGTFSTNFPVQTGGYSTVYNGGKADGYIVKINPAGNAILKGTYVGTPSYDQSYFVQKDKSNNIYVYGQSQGIMPTVGAVYSNPNSHQFITRFDNQLSNINLATVVGSGQASVDISPSAFSVDNCGNIYISGWGGNITNTLQLSGMPTTTNAIYATPPNGFDFYLLALSQNMAGLLYGTYFGGNCSQEHVDGGTSRFDPAGKIYQSVCAGCGGNDDFPVPNGKWPCGIITPCPPGPNLNSNCNNGVFKIDFQLQVAVSTINTNTLSGCAPLTISFTNATAPTGTLATFIWYLGNGQTTTTNINPTVTYTNPGTYTVSLVVNDNTTCNVKDSAVTFITVYPRPTANFSLTTGSCSNTITTINGSTGNFGSNPYTWNFGNSSPTSSLTSPSYTYPTTGSYTVSLSVVDLNGCTSIATNTVTIFNFIPGIVNSSTICQGYSTPINASGGTSYTWSPPPTLSNPNSASPIATPSVTTIYSVQIDNNSPGYTCSKTLTTQVTVYPKPNADFTFTTNPCGGGVNYFDLSTATITAWQWTLSTILTSTVQNPYNFYYNGGTHSITLIVTNTYGCKDTATKIITVVVPPAVAVTGGNICKGGYAPLSATGGISYLWSPGASLNLDYIPYPTASPSVTTQYSVVITTSNSCVFLLTTNVIVSEISTTPISANAVPPSIVQGNTSTLTYFGDPGAFVQWSPNNHIVPTTGYSVIATPDRSTTYTITITKGPCKENLLVYVEVNLNGCIETDVFVPNTFTPNGDGNNDILYVRGLKVSEVYFAVYNRWGELVWETNDKTKGWDGIYKGKPADVGVFGWYLKVKCFDGQDNFKKGNVTLIR